MSTKFRGLAASQTDAQVERVISYEELKKHANYSDAWISINRTVYDITDFIDRHPHGDVFRGNLGAEVGGLFSSAHTTKHVEEWIKDKSFLEKNQIKIVGRLDVSNDKLHKGNDMPFLDRIVYMDTDKDEFWIDLKTSVAAFLKENNLTTHYTDLEGILYIIYFMCIHVALSYLTWVKGSFIASIVQALHAICMLANIAHMSTHSAFTNNPFLDFISMHLFDLAGASGLQWQIAHQTHHNQPHSSLDHQTNQYPLYGLRVHKYMKHRFYHRFQRGYFWIATAIFHSLVMYIATTLWIIRYKHHSRHYYDLAAHFIAKGILMIQVAYAVHLHGWLIGVGLFVVYLMAFSNIAFLLLFNDHEETHAVLGEMEDVKNYHEKLSWAEVQVRTSGDWYPTNWFLAFIEFQYGYFNYHIEHHLFPTFKPSLLKKISPVVKSVCLKHGLPYISTPFFEKQRSLQSHIANLSKPDHEN